MKGIFKILKLILASLLTIYSLIILYFLVLSSAGKRYDIASNMQGVYLSQSMFEILKNGDPSNDDIYFEQSVPHNKRGDHEKGFELLDKAVELDPKMHLGYRGYMKIRFLRDFEGALEDLDRLDSLTPQVIDTPWGEDIDFLRGEAWYGLNEYEKASNYFSRSIENQGKEWVDIQAFVYAGNSEYKLGNPETAIDFYNQALEQSKYTVEAHLGLARIYAEKEQVQEARSHLELAKQYFVYKRNDPYNEYLNEIYWNDISSLEDQVL